APCANDRNNTASAETNGALRERMACLAPAPGIEPT
ncbi:hypothetical protein A2U01_0110014, partial [Trifolium medium]|nr:hypothetical protein [Trifolium medium]